MNVLINDNKVINKQNYISKQCFCVPNWYYSTSFIDKNFLPDYLQRKNCLERIIILLLSIIKIIAVILILSGVFAASYFPFAYYFPRIKFVCIAMLHLVSQL